MGRANKNPQPSRTFSSGFPLSTFCLSDLAGPWGRERAGPSEAMFRRCTKGRPHSLLWARVYQAWLLGARWRPPCWAEGLRGLHLLRGAGSEAHTLPTSWAQEAPPHSSSGFLNSWLSSVPHNFLTMSLILTAYTWKVDLQVKPSLRLKTKEEEIEEEIRWLEGK